MIHHFLTRWGKRQHLARLHSLWIIETSAGNAARAASIARCIAELNEELERA